ncbi:hypothetical protein ONZ45_g18146 [Pleurotus djamor]|nr:hypothetical protein ONZ45_g18146 [Pleurotus djamor]
MQVATSAPNFVIQEMSWKIHYNVSTTEGDEADLYTYLKDPSVFAIENGYIAILQRPGIGIEINENLVREVAAKHFVQQSPWTNPVWRGKDGSIIEW